MAGIEDLKKGMSKIADDEYYASLQKFIERDPGASNILIQMILHILLWINHQITITKDFKCRLKIQNM